MPDVIDWKAVLEAIVVIQLLKPNLVHNRALALVTPPYSVVFLVPRDHIIIVQVCTARNVV